jgi:2-C-methyl-D-erythritol 2,4-cyclodiphosphate synthase
MTRIGTGWDLHPLVSGRPLMLGGIAIEHDKGEAGHSDGDVLVHAVIDAILGALAKGDIGQRFPDSDPLYENADSMELLRQVRKEELDGSYAVSNLDCTVILQRPKLRPYIDSIRASLSAALQTEPGQVSVKAKTAEGLLGEVGTGDAIIAQTVILLVPVDTNSQNTL